MARARHARRKRSSSRRPGSRSTPASSKRTYANGTSKVEASSAVARRIAAIVAAPDILVLRRQQGELDLLERAAEGGILRALRGKAGIDVADRRVGPAERGGDLG